jgi:anti-sigma factor RsiW
MHGAIRDRLEELLRPARAANLKIGTEQHLAECVECSAELASMRAHSEALRGLRGPEGVELPASFYSNVLRKIEEKKRTSVWYSLVCSPFSSRLVYASLTFAVLVGSYLVTQEERDGHLEATAVMARNTHYDAPVFGDQVQQRDAVLTNFASH